jgi:hypothetical protein
MSTRKCRSCGFRWAQTGCDGLCRHCARASGDERSLLEIERDVLARKMAVMRNLEVRVYVGRPNPEVEIHGQQYEVVFP